MHDGCWGLLDFFRPDTRADFSRQPSSVGPSLLFAGGNHLKESVLNGNYAPYNFQFIAGDLFPAVILLLFAWKYSHRPAATWHAVKAAVEL